MLALVLLLTWGQGSGFGVVVVCSLFLDGDTLVNFGWDSCPPTSSEAVSNRNGVAIFSSNGV